MAQKSSVGEMGIISNLRVGETGVGEMGVGKMGVGEMGIPRNVNVESVFAALTIQKKGKKQN